jgi:hypothetical protein
MDSIIKHPNISISKVSENALIEAIRRLKGSNTFVRSGNNVLENPTKTLVGSRGFAQGTNGDITRFYPATPFFLMHSCIMTFLIYF